MNMNYRIITQTPPTTVKRQDGTETQKCSLVMQELGGKYANSYVATLLGNLAKLQFKQNDIVVAALRFTHREYNGAYYMDCMVQDIVKLDINSIF